MEENLKSKLGFFFFFFFVFCLAIGGFFYLKYMKSEEKNLTKREDSISENYKIDQDREYIYFINEETISEKGELYYKDVVINLNTQVTLTEALKKENEIFKNNIKYISQTEILNNSLITYNYDDIYSIMFRDYKTFEFGKYVSLLIRDYDYSCFDGVTYNNSKAYVFDINSGNLLNENELFNMFSINIDRLKEKIKTYLESKQSKIAGVDVIKIEDTLEGINTSSLFVNEYGHLALSYLVKTTQTDYNEITEV